MQMLFVYLHRGLVSGWPPRLQPQYLQVVLQLGRILDDLSIQVGDPALVKNIHLIYFAVVDIVPERGLAEWVAGNAAGYVRSGNY